jgi:DNA processing protein
MRKITNDILIKLLQLPRIGRKTAFKIVDNLVQNINSDDELYNFLLNPKIKIKLPSFDESQITTAITKANIIISQNSELDIKCTSYYDEDFPIYLRNISDPPIILYSLGNFSKLNNLPSVGIIGTRHPSSLGISSAKRFGEIFGEKDFNVVSGLAIGCDASAHRGCLDKCGFTTAVLAHGLDVVYPKENTAIADEIIKSGGVLISEYSVGQSSRPNYFIERDRIQAGLSDGIIVVETDQKGGTMHTAGYAKDYNKFIGVFKHPDTTAPHRMMEGNKLLLSEGCISLSNKEDVVTFANKLRNSRNKNDSKFSERSTGDQLGDQLSLL